MDELYARLNYLLDAFLNKKASEQEKDELFVLIRQADNDEDLHRVLQRAWNNFPQAEDVFPSARSGQILSNILSPPEQNIPFINPKNNWRMYYAAAAAALFIGFAVLLFSHKKRKTNQLITKVKPHDAILPGSNKAVLKLANGKTIVLDSAHIGTIINLKNTCIKKAQDGLLVYNAGRPQLNQPSAINTITTPRGGQYQVILPDGSKVWLNAASSVSFPTQFTGKIRQVSVSGEAY
ncbi:MAG: hypothetical protein EOP42_19955, partial [Sphingobacteriaceae bacterium]